MRMIYVVFLLLVIPVAQGQSQFPERLPHQAVSIRWSSQGDLYATGHVDGSVRIYDNATLITVIPNAHTAPIYGLAFSPDSSRVASGGEDNNLRVWNVATGQLVEEFLNVGQFVDAVEWNSNGNIIWIAPFGGSNHIIFVDIITDTYTVSQTIDRGPSEDISWKPDNTMVAIGGRGTDVVIVIISDYSLRLLDATPDTDFFEPPNEFTTSVTWHPTANIVANGKVNGWIHVWDLDSPSDTIPMLSFQANDGATDDAHVPFEYTVLDIEFSADGSVLSSVSRDGTIRMWDAETGELLSDTNVGETILAGAFSPGGGTLVYSTYSQVDEPLRVIQIFDVSTDYP